MTEYELKTKATERFYKYGTEGQSSKMFDNLPDEDQRFWKNKFQPDREIPILTSYKDENNWALITTRYISWKQNDSEFNLKLSEIERAKVNLKRFLSNGGKPGYLNVIYLIAGDSNYDFYTETGGPHTGTLYLLSFLVLNQKSPVA